MAGSPPLSGATGEASAANELVPAKLGGEGSHGQPPSEAQHPAVAAVAAEDGGLEVVWNGARPRLMRKLKMGAAAPDPDFSSAQSRAITTAMRLGLPAAVEQAARGGGGDSPRISPGMPRAAVGASRRGAQQRRQQQQMAGGSSSPRGSARKGGTESWLTDSDYLDQVSDKIAEVQHFISRRGPDQARRATASLASTWHKPSQSVDSPRLHMQAPSVALEGVLLRKLRPEGVAEYAKAMGTEYSLATQQEADANEDAANPPMSVRYRGDAW